MNAIAPFQRLRSQSEVYRAFDSYFICRGRERTGGVKSVAYVFACSLMNKAKQRDRVYEFIS